MQIEIFDVLPSTNDMARARAIEGAPHLFTVQAKAQSDGRGRRGRCFLSPVGGTYFSTVLRPSIPRENYGVIPPVAALLVRRALLRAAGISTDIKWVNDLLLAEKKLAGLLALSGVDRTGRPFAVLGVGINTGGTVPAEIAALACAIHYPDTTALVREIVTELAALDSLLATGEWLAEYRANASLLGKEITVYEGGSVRHATALDILPDGALQIREADGRITALTGDEITLRRTN